ncbi:DUF1963 domain-containing protein [Microbacterium sp. CFH 31415]|uniref:DUF1963 domain-containing protein n=1 Tax=Microbacterium sp. CFH 31415 TaxID=2921732 RepID=UPI001F13591E|nr:DUF1963 domain-containing protein [Microbacterium sp. CFH 31415]MCH6231237.1 DUF1963 domain-containing protein [Microbacterium sp. CFH 31415]
MTIRDADRPPIHGRRMAAIEWLQRPEYRVAGLSGEVAFSVAYTEQSFDPGPAELQDLFWPTGSEVSWLGGPAGGVTEDDWPRRADGRPLAHVATFDLADAYNTIDAESRSDWPPGQEGLPHHGVLQIFHDLTDTYGYEPDDRLTRGWRVLWDPQPDRSLLTTGPADLELPTDACQVILPLATFTVPSAADAIGAPTAVFEATDAANDQLQRMWAWQRTLNRAAEPIPFTHLYGHAQNGNRHAALNVLPTCLPLTIPGDRYRLVAEIEGQTTLEGWFGDGSPLEVWMRDSDLRARAFDAAWCIIRSD